MDNQNTTVIDLTYFCNASCNYCRWGNSKTTGRKNQEIESLLLPSFTIQALGIQRVVLSGGEPRLHPRLGEIIEYYRNKVDDVIMITNGYGISLREISRLTEMGVTGLAISIDSVVPEEELASRRTSQRLFKNLLQVLSDASIAKRGFELGINSVVSNVNGNWNSVRSLLQYAAQSEVDYVKFQPLFDDGYVSNHCPWLKLNYRDAPRLREVARNLSGVGYIATNSSEFWLDLADMVSGQELAGSSCGLGQHKSNVINGELTMCYWKKNSTYGIASDSLEDSRIGKAQSSLSQEKSGCKVDFHCFCNQKVRHAWKRTN